MIEAEFRTCKCFYWRLRYVHQQRSDSEVDISRFYTSQDVSKREEVSADTEELPSRLTVLGMTEPKLLPYNKSKKAMSDNSPTLKSIHDASCGHEIEFPATSTATPRVLGAMTFGEGIRILRCNCKGIAHVTSCTPSPTK